MNPILRFECGDCGQIHDSLDEAEGCCPPDITEVYECSDCGTCYDLKIDAEQCCKDDEDDD